VGNSKSKSSLQRAAYSIPEFCFHNNISRVTYHRLRAEGRGPREMRLGLNKVLVSAKADQDWQERMEEAAPEVETRAVERAVKAGTTAVKSARHVSNRMKGGPAEHAAKMGSAAIKRTRHPTKKSRRMKDSPEFIRDEP
jgi:hypothetical protein